MLNFNDLGLDEVLLKNLALLGHVTPTSIQALAIPSIMEGRDVLGMAQTGTGKTGAFGLPVIHRLLKGVSGRGSKGPRALILAPTRELCSQIHGALEAYARESGLKGQAVYGGVGQGEQVKALREGVDVVVATPGRLLDLLEQRHLTLARIETFVVDEADRMLDMGFIDDIQDILGRLPAERQTMLFSATMPEGIKALAAKMLRDPRTFLSGDPSGVTGTIRQKVIHCRNVDKFQLLKKILKEEAKGLVIVFTRTKNTADSVVEYLAQNRMASRSLHGDKAQEERERAITQFSGGDMRILIATDIASRGIDVEEVGHVINFDLPLDPESYVHRIGRSARAGRAGEAISFCDDAERDKLERIQRFLKMDLPAEKFSGRPEVLKLRAVRKVTAPTPGRSQEKTAYLDHSKRQGRLTESERKSHPGFMKAKKKKRK